MSKQIKVSGTVQKIFQERQVGRRSIRYVLLRAVKNFHSPTAMIRLCMEGCKPSQIVDYQQLGLEVGQQVAVEGSYKRLDHRGKVIQSRVILAQDLRVLPPPAEPKPIDVVSAD